MEYSDEELMKMMEELFQKVRRQHTGHHERGGFGRPGFEGRGHGPQGRPGAGRERFCRTEETADMHRGPAGEEGRFGGRPSMMDRYCPGDGRPPMDRRPPMARERVLRLIGMEGQISQNKLAASLDIRPQSLSELLVKLENDGYIVRVKNEQDKREILVSLTEQGKERSKEVEAERTKQVSGFFAPLTTEEREQLWQLLMKLSMQGVQENE